MNALQPGPLALTFHLGRIPVVVQPTFWLGALLLGRGLSGRELVLWALVLLVAVLVHELGHALAYSAFGAGAGIELVMLGGLCYGDRQLSRWRQVVVSLAGPFAGFVLGGVGLLAEWLWPPVNWLHASLYSQLKFVTFGYGILNLIPVIPLDGGHVLQGVLGPRRQRAAWLVSGLVGAAMVGLGLWLQQPFLAVMFGLYGFRSLQTWHEWGNARPTPSRPVPAGPRLGAAEGAEQLKAGWAALRSGDVREAVRLATQVEEQGRAEARPEALELRAWAALADEEPHQALLALGRLPEPQAVRALTWAMVLEANGRDAEALPHAQKAHAQEPTDTTAALLAQLYRRTGDAGRAEGVVRQHPWHNTARRESLLGELHLAQGRLPEAADCHARAFEAGGDLADALGAARALVRAGRSAEARGWLARAREAGLEEEALQALRKDADLAPLLSEDPVAA